MNEVLNELPEIKSESEKFPALAEIVDFEELNSGKKKFEEEAVKFLTDISLKFLEGIKNAGESLDADFILQAGDDIFEIFQKGTHLSSKEVVAFFQKNVGEKIMVEFIKQLDSNFEAAKEWKTKADQESEVLFEEFLNSILEEGRNKFFKTMKMSKETK